VTCPALDVPAHGAVNCSHPSEQLTWGTTCEFSCEEGFTLTGAATLQCGSSGAWDRQQPQCAAVTCPALDVPAHGAVNCSHPSEQLTWGTTCEFSCEEGFTLTGAATLQCGSSGAWDRQQPQCAVTQCEALSSPEKGSMDCSHGAGMFTYNTSCHFSCLEGWNLNGSRVLECSPSGNWSASLPTCEASDQASYISVGIAATSASLLSTASFLLWLARRF
ncbi:LYAM2 protein, partial [Spizella passerina]|nr:LYAM2 protein [Spizella passerina]